MSSPPPEVLEWSASVLGTDVTVVRGMRAGGTPWLLRAGNREVVLRVARAKFVTGTATEIAAMIHVAKSAGASFPIAELLGYDLAEQTSYGLVLTSRVRGTGVIPAEPDPERLRAIGAIAARISSVGLTPTAELPLRSRSIEGEDFAAMRRKRGASDLLRAAEDAVAATRPDDRRLGLVHGDLWYGNTLWDEGTLTAVLDWDCAGVGPAGIDLASVRWRPGATASKPPTMSCAAGKPRPAGPPATLPTGISSGRSRPRRTWAGLPTR